MLAPLADDYDYVFLDCPPSISLVSESVFEAADALLVPLIPATLSSRTFAQLPSSSPTRATAPQVLGVLLDGRRPQAPAPRGHGASSPATHPDVLRTAIPAAERRRAHGPATGPPIAEFAPAQPRRAAYEALWAEVRERLGLAGRSVDRVVAPHRPGRRGLPAGDRGRRRRARGSARRELVNGVYATAEARALARRAGHGRRTPTSRSSSVRGQLAVGRARRADRRLHPRARRSRTTRASSACSQRPRPSRAAASAVRSSRSPRSTAASADCARSSSSCSSRATGGIRAKELLRAWYGRMGYRLHPDARASRRSYPAARAAAASTPCEIETYEKALRPEPPPARLPRDRRQTLGSLSGDPHDVPPAARCEGGSRYHHPRTRGSEMTFSIRPRGAAGRAAPSRSPCWRSRCFDSRGGRRRRRDRDDRGAAARPPTAAPRRAAVTVTRTDGPPPGFWSYACDREDSGGKDGTVVVSDLPVGAYRLEEGAPPDAFKLAPGVVLGDRGRRRHRHRDPHAQPLPPLRVVTTTRPRAGARRLLLADPPPWRVRGLHRRGVRRRRRRQRRHDDVQDDPPRRLRDPPHGGAEAVPPARRRHARSRCPTPTGR